MQNKDARLNPSLWKSCTRDINAYCGQEFRDLETQSDELNGKVLQCLKKSFVTNKLSKQCEVEVEEVMREAANVSLFILFILHSYYFEHQIICLPKIYILQYTLLSNNIYIYIYISFF